MWSLHNKYSAGAEHNAELKSEPETDYPDGDLIFGHPTSQVPSCSSALAYTIISTQDLLCLLNVHLVFKFHHLHEAVSVPCPSQHAVSKYP